MKYFACAVLFLTLGCGQTVKTPVPARDNAKLEHFNGRLAAALAITESQVKNDALKTLAVEAAAARFGEIARSALEKINESSARNAAAKDAAHQLSKLGDAQAATEIAQLINESTLKNEVLAKIAKGE